jgi:uncharacterized protein involved in outer membrane biogenesis
VLTLAALLVAILLLLVSLGITVTLDPLRPSFEAAASSALGREVALEGSMVLVPTFWPTVEVQSLRIANPPAWPVPDFARMELARLQIGVLPLVWERRLQVRELTAEGVSLLLHRAAGGQTNWDFAALESPARPQDPEAPANAEEVRERLLTAAQLEALQLRDIALHYRDDTSGEDIVFAVNELFAEAATDLPSKLSMEGSFRAHPFSASLTTGNPMGLVTGDEAWPLELTLEIAGTTLQLSGQLDEGLDEGPLPDLGASGEAPPAEAAPEAGRRFGEFSLSLRGERLSSLDELVGIALPPLGPHSFEGHFRAFAGKRYEAQVVVGVGTSRLEGTMTLTTAQRPPRVEIDLASEALQLDDFDAGDWSPFGGEAADAGAGEPEQPSDLSEPLRTRALLSPELMQRVDARLSVRVGEVRSGADRLGSAQLSAKLEKGRLSLDPLELSVLGGSLRSTAALHPTAERVSGQLTTRVDRFDYGILLRRVDPETELRGLFALDLALRSSAPSIETFMEHASGHLDFAAFPEEFEAGMIDLWAVNLFSAVLPLLESGELPKINCVVGLFDMNDGRIEERSILVDTSRMSVTGEAEVDFRKQTVKIELAPSPKKPEFFSLATPIQIDGTFSDFGAGVNPESLPGTVIRFVTSIVHVPVQRIFRDARPAEDLEACLAAMQRAEK